MGTWPSAWPLGAGGAESRSSFRAEVRGDVTSTAWGEAEFGAVQNPDRSSGAFVVSLGVCSPRSAILFTQRNGTPLGVGRYRIAEDANEPDEILALVLTGSPTRPTGTFRGQAGWLVVTAASDRVITGRFQVDAIGFLAAEPSREDRRVNVTGSLSATTVDGSGGRKSRRSRRSSPSAAPSGSSGDFRTRACGKPAKSTSTASTPP